MSQTYILAVVQLLAVLLPIIGVRVGDDALTVTVQTVVVVASAAYIALRRYLKGGINILGVRN